MFFQFPYSAFTRCPDLGRYVIEYLETLPVGEFSDFEIEAGVVYKYDGIRFPPEYVLLAAAEFSEQLAGFQEHFPESHDGPVPVVADESCAVLMAAVDFIHQLSAPETDVGRGIGFVKPPHQIGAVQVSRCFSCYDIILHDLPWKSVSTAALMRL